MSELHHAINGPPNWQTADIFCRVIDNLGDIGVCWRLARQLQAEHRLSVRLWVDDLQSFALLCPALDKDAVVQDLDGIEVRQWGVAELNVEPAALVIEGFACQLPQDYMQAMARLPVSPTWINLDYLTAEAWAEGCHGLWSRHPRLPLEQLFFFPGFSERSGGLLREHDVLQRREQFDGSAQADFWRQLQLPAPDSLELRVSLFCYESDSVASLLRGWSSGDQRISCVVPAGRALRQVEQWLQQPLAPGTSCHRGSLHLHAVPLLAHADYDRLLWACDFNIVRGEDSFVRAQWAARPLLWHIYPQAEDAHWPKLAAFARHYLSGLEASAATALEQLWHQFNRGLPAADSWAAVCGHLPALRRHAQHWSEKLALQQDLASRLVKFHQERVQSRVL